MHRILTDIARRKIEIITRVTKPSQSVNVLGQFLDKVTNPKWGENGEVSSHVSVSVIA